ncbi:MAG: hypothetical protein ACYTDY_11655 [Planctomycetota bacterium]|jgi:hypothetical protein
MEPAVLIVLGIVLVVVIGFIAWRLEKKRREALRRWARDGGWRLDERKRGRPDLPFGLFDHGHSRYSRYHATKSIPDAVPGLDHAYVELFEYHYAVTTSSGKTTSTSHYHFHCALVEPGLDVGEVTIRDETIGDKLVQAIGFDDIDFEDHEFSKKFVVKARDRKGAYDLIDQRMMSFLLDHRGWHTEAAGRMVFIHRSGRPTAERFAALADFVTGFLAEIPRTLVNEERVARGLPPAVDAGNVARHHRRDP